MKKDVSKPYKYVLIFLVLFSSSMLLTNCNPSGSDDFGVGTVEGLRPIYALENANILHTAAKKINNPGKIYVYGDYLFISEKMQGIHIIDNSNPEFPQPVGFIQVPGNADMAVKENVLYVDNLKDLVAIDISDPTQTKEIKRIKNVFSASDQYPTQDGIYFECVDESKGYVIGWEKAILEDPKCRN